MFYFLLLPFYPLNIVYDLAIFEVVWLVFKRRTIIKLIQPALLPPIDDPLRSPQFHARNRDFRKRPECKQVTVDRQIHFFQRIEAGFFNQGM